MRCRCIKFRRALCAAAILLGLYCDARGALAEAGATAPHCLFVPTHGLRCDLLIGAGTTFWPWHWTDGVVAPFMLEFDDSRWELGAFRFTTSQYLKSPAHPPSTISAQPYWGVSFMRRWQVLHRSGWRLYLGFGASYKTEVDLLDATRWNSPICSRFDTRSGRTESSSSASDIGRTLGSSSRIAARICSRSASAFGDKVAPRSPL